MVIMTVLAMGLAGWFGTKGPEKAPPKTVAAVDLEQYVGSWYEIARYPNWFEKKCARDVVATYGATEKPGRITVKNECRKADGSLTVAKGLGRVVGPGKLEVSFFRPFWGDYWVLALDPEYRWSLVGDPKRSCLWILSRTPTLSAETLEIIKAKAAEQGFDLGKLVMTVQGGK